MRRLLFTIAFALLLPATAHANMAAPWSGGEVAGEPAGIHGIAIAGETLDLDLRPLADDAPAAISATYHLANHGAAQKLDLVFAAGAARVEFFVVKLDGRALPSRPIAAGDLATRWKTPDTTPDPHGGPAFGYRPRGGATFVAFAAEIPPGEHTLQVSYVAEAVRFSARGEATVARQLGYVLSPARDWDGFGGLDVTVHAPAGWLVATDPTLARTGDSLQAHFDALPGDALGITVQAPPGAVFPVLNTALPIVAVLVFLGGFPWCWRRGRSRRGSLGMAAAGSSFMWAAAVLGSGLLAVFGPALALPAGQANHHGYADAFGVVIVVLATFAALLLGAVVTLAGGRGRVQ